MVSESKLTLDILPLTADTARLVRVYGTAPCVVLPSVLPAPEGGSFAVTELGGYCFSEKPRSLPAADKISLPVMVSLPGKGVQQDVGGGLFDIQSTKNMLLSPKSSGTILIFER